MNYFPLKPYVKYFKADTKWFALQLEYLGDNISIFKWYISEYSGKWMKGWGIHCFPSNFNMVKLNYYELVSRPMCEYLQGIPNIIFILNVA